MKRANLTKKSNIPSLPCTFIIKVSYAERNTIQGNIQWLETEKTVAFRSYMELLHLIQEALQVLQNGLVRFRYWEF